MARGNQRDLAREKAAKKSKGKKLGLHVDTILNSGFEGLISSA